MRAGISVYPGNPGKPLSQNAVQQVQRLDSQSVSQKGTETQGVSLQPGAV